MCDADASAQNNKLRESVNALLADARLKEARNTTLRQEAKDLLSGQGAALTPLVQSPAPWPAFGAISLHTQYCIAQRHSVLLL